MDIYLRGNYKSFTILKVLRAKKPTQRVILNIHGSFGLSGDNGSKSELLGKRILKENIGNMVHFSSSRDWNIFEDGNFDKMLKGFGSKTFTQEANDVRDTIDLLLDQSKFLFGQKKIKIYIVGSSLGGTIAATLSDKFNFIDKIVLVGSPAKPILKKYQLMRTAPSEDKIKKSAEGFKGSVFLLQGSLDEVVPLKSGERLLSFFKHAKSKKKLIVNGVNHNFSAIFGKNKRRAFAVYVKSVTNFLRS